MYLFEVKKPAESKGPWDYYKMRATIPAAEAFRPLERRRMPAGEVANVLTRLRRPAAGAGPFTAHEAPAMF